MKLSHALLTVVLMTAAGGLAGMGMGYALGKYAPGYYEQMFRRSAEHGPRRPSSRNPPPRELNPVHVGVGLGLTQGLAAGFFGSIVLVLGLSWLRSRGRGRREEEAAGLDED